MIASYISNTPPASVLACREVARSVIRLDLYAPWIAATAEPGQFVMVDALPRLLKRPISIGAADRSNGTITLYIKVIGTGTRIIADLTAGEKVGCFGPFGSTFTIGTANRPLLIGGGIGFPPVDFLARRFIDAGITPKLIYGVATHDEVIEEERLTSGYNISFTSVDGSIGTKGFVTTLIGDITYDAVYACGPMAMLAAIKKATATARIPVQLSVEERMACGVGVCVGCVVETRNGYKRACVEGPVFDAEELFV